MLLRSLIATAAAALVMAAPASPAAGRGCQTLDPHARLACANTAIHAGRTGIGWLASHRPVLVGERRYFAFLGAPVPIPAPWTLVRYRQALVGKRWLLRYGLGQRAAALRLLNPWPAHHALWMCIHGDPAYGSHYGNEASSWQNHDSGRTNHWGGLQMHPGWGPLPGTADRYSQLEQENAAEGEYQRSGFSHAWLAGQWGQTVGLCWRYA